MWSLIRADVKNVQVMLQTFVLPGDKSTCLIYTVYGRRFINPNALTTILQGFNVKLTLLSLSAVCITDMRLQDAPN